MLPETPTIYVERRDFEETKSIRGTRDLLERHLGEDTWSGGPRARLLRTDRDNEGRAIMVFASPLDVEGTGARIDCNGNVVTGRESAAQAVRYACACNGWQVLSIERKPLDVPGRADKPGFHALTEVTICINRTGAQIVDIDPGHGRGFCDGAYYGGPGAWGGYGVRNAAGPWYRFTYERGLQPAPAGEAIAYLKRRAERICAADRAYMGAHPGGW